MKYKCIDSVFDADSEYNISFCLGWKIQKFPRHDFSDFGVEVPRFQHKSNMSRTTTDFEKKRTYFCSSSDGDSNYISHMITSLEQKK